MNFYQKELDEKKAYPHKKPKDKKDSLLSTRMHRMKHTKKNAQFGMF